MGAAALCLVLGAAVLHAGWNRLLHSCGDPQAVVAFGALVGAAILLPGVVLRPPFSLWPLILGSGVAQAAYFRLLSAAYRRAPFSLTYPIARASGPLFVTLGGVLALSQPLTVEHVLGALGLGGGLVLIAATSWRRGANAAIWLALACGVAIACYSLIDARAVRSVSPFGYLAATSLVQAGVLWLWLRFDWRRLARALAPGIAVGLGSTAAYLLVLFAFQRAPAGPVATVRELSILVGIALARERVGWRVWVGGALCVLGALAAAL